MFNRAYRLHLEVLWIFRHKARLAYHRVRDEEVTSDLVRGSYSVDSKFRGEQYQPHALFCKPGDKKSKFIQGHDWDKVVRIGKLLAAGHRMREIASMANVDVGTVTRLRNHINEFRGIPFRCKCGEISGHNNTKLCNNFKKKGEL